MHPHRYSSDSTLYVLRLQLASPETGDDDDSKKAGKPWRSSYACVVCRSFVSSPLHATQAKSAGRWSRFQKGSALLDNSPGVALLERLQGRWAVHAEYADSMTPQSVLPHITKYDEVERWHLLGLSFFDLIVVATRQDGLDYDCLSRLKRTKVEIWCA